jgi:hypothetical protein
MQMDELAHAIARPMPSIEDILGATPTEQTASRFLVVGAFEESGTVAAGTTSQALAFYLSALLQGQCATLSVEPAYLLAPDARGEYQEKYPGAVELNESLLRRLAPDLLLSGQIAQVRDELNVVVQVFNRRTGETVALPSISTNLANLDDPLVDAMQSVVGAFCRDARLPRELPGSFSELVPSFAERTPFATKLRALRETFERKAGGSAVALKYLEQLWGNGHGMETITAAKTALARYPSSIAVQTFANYLLIMEGPRSADVAALDRLRKLCLSLPSDYACKLALLDAYRIEKVMYHSPQGFSGTIQVISGAIDHHEGTARAIALGIDLVERQPENFRAWFHLSMSLAKYASLVRGTRYWRELGEDQRRRYTAIQKQASTALRKAQALHPQHPWIHEEMMALASVSGGSFMDSFRRTVALDPERISAYQTAYNYARPQWGGTREMLQEIYETSTRNNPNADWTENLRKIWAKELSFWRVGNGWAWLAAAAMAATAVAGWLRLRVHSVPRSPPT